MTASPSRRSRRPVIAAVAAVAAAGLAACGGGSGATQAPSAPSAAASPGSPSPTRELRPDVVPPPAATPSATPEPTGERTPQSLAAQVRISAPALADPLVAEAVTAYQDFVVQYAVAQGLPDAGYAPMLARLSERLSGAQLNNLRSIVAADELILGTFDETVKAAAGTAEAVVITSCADASSRKVYDRSTGAAVRPVMPATVPLAITMRHPADRWVVDGYTRAGEGDVTCP